MTGVDDPAHASRLNGFDLVTPDGQPVRWAMNLLHHTGLRDRVYGPKLTFSFARKQRSEGFRCLLWKQRHRAQHLRERLPTIVPGLQIAGMQPSKFGKATPEELDRIADDVKASGAKITMVGLGCPRQEIFVYENRERFGMPLIAVGAAFDYHAGLQSEPPAWMQRWGLQWLYRLGQDPKRLWRRYVILNPRFIWNVARQRAGRGKVHETVTPPFVGWA